MPPAAPARCNRRDGPSFLNKQIPSPFRGCRTSTHDAPLASNERDTPTCKKCLDPSRCATWRCTASILGVYPGHVTTVGYVWGTRGQRRAPDGARLGIENPKIPRIVALVVFPRDRCHFDVHECHYCRYFGILILGALRLEPVAVGACPTHTHSGHMSRTARLD